MPRCAGVSASARPRPEPGRLQDPGHTHAPSSMSMAVAVGAATGAGPLAYTPHAPRPLRHCGVHFDRRTRTMRAPQCAPAHEHEGHSKQLQVSPVPKRGHLARITGGPNRHGHWDLDPERSGAFAVRSPLRGTPLHQSKAHQPARYKFQYAHLDLK